MPIRTILSRLAVLVLLVLPTAGCVTYAKMRTADGIAVSDALALPVPMSEPAGDTAPAEEGNIEVTTNAAARLMTYDATLTLVVQDAERTLAQLRAMSVRLGGYMQSLADNAIVLRIPAARLNDALHEAEQCGEVTSRQITGNDVTGEMLDLDTRLRNMQAARDRLATLLEQATKVEEVLAVEKELQRITENLELLKGRIKYLTHAVAYSTLTVRLNAPLAQTELKEAIPFDWVHGLAQDVVPDPGVNYSAEQKFREWIRMELPPGCVKLHETKGYTRAMTGTGVAILVRREKNFENGSLAFWEPLVRRSLAAERTLALGETLRTPLKNGTEAIKITGTRTIGRKTYQYVLWLTANEDDVHTFEAWGETAPMAAIADALDQSAKSMRIKP